MNKKSFTMVVLILMSIIGSSCGGTANIFATATPTATDTPLPTATAIPTSTPLPTVTPTATPLPTAIPDTALGVPISKGGWQLTLVEIKTETSLKMGGYGNSVTSTPNEGFAFLILSVTIRNLDPTHSLSISQDNIAIVDSGGAIKTAVGGGWADDNMCGGCAFLLSQDLGSSNISSTLFAQASGTFNAAFGSISPGSPISFVFILPKSELEKEWKLQFQDIPPFAFKLGDQVNYPLSTKVENIESQLPGECTAENIQAAQKNMGIVYQAWDKDVLAVHFGKLDNSPFSELCKGYAYNDLDFSKDGAVLMVAGPLQGWPNLYLIDPEGKVTTLAQNALNVEARFVPGTDYVIFKVAQIGKEGSQLYIMDRKKASTKLLVDGKWANYRVFQNGNVYVNAMPLDSTSNLELFGQITEAGIPQINLPKGVSSSDITEDGSHLLYTDYQNGETYLYYADIDGSNKKEILKGDIGSDSKFISPDGKSILMSTKGSTDENNKQAILQDLASNKITLITPESDEVEYRFSPDGQWVAAVSTFKRADTDKSKTKKQSLFIFGNKDGKVVKEIQGEIVNYLFAPDNSYIAYTIKGEDEALNMFVLSLNNNTEQPLGNGILVGWTSGQ